MEKDYMNPINWDKEIWQDAAKAFPLIIGSLLTVYVLIAIFG